MNVTSKSEEATLLLLTSKKELYPFSTSALQVSQATFKEQAEYIDSLIVYRDGTVRKIDGIKRLGLYGKNFVSKFKSALFGIYSISVTLSEVSLSFEEIKNLIIEYLEIDLSSSNGGFDFVEKTDDVLARIKYSTNVHDIFKVINLPEPIDCLDVL